MSASETELDLFCELTNVGGANAATAVGEMLGTFVDMGTPRASEVTLAEVAQIVGTEGFDPVAVVVVVTGELAGTIALVIDRPEAVGEAISVPEELLESALAEIGNVMAARFIVSVGQLVGFSGAVEPPGVALAPRCAALDAVIALASTTEPFLVLRADLAIGQERAADELLFLPAPGTVERLSGLV